MKEYRVEKYVSHQLLSLYLTLLQELIVWQRYRRGYSPVESSKLVNGATGIGCDLLSLIIRHHPEIKLVSARVTTVTHFVKSLKPFNLFFRVCKNVVLVAFHYGLDRIRTDSLDDKRSDFLLSLSTEEAYGYETVDQTKTDLKCDYVLVIQ